VPVDELRLAGAEQIEVAAGGQLLGQLDELCAKLTPEPAQLRTVARNLTHRSPLLPPCGHPRGRGGNR
jgi:hypothetical protein